MARALCLEFELIPEIPLLRGYLRAPDGPIHDIVEVTPTGADDYGAFLGGGVGSNRSARPDDHSQFPRRPWSGHCTQDTDQAGLSGRV